jgi:hypothetical protein
MAAGDAGGQWTLALEGDVVKPFLPGKEAHLALLEERLRQLSARSAGAGTARGGGGRAAQRGLAAELAARREEEHAGAAGGFERHLAASRPAVDDDEVVEPLLDRPPGVSPAAAAAPAAAANDADDDDGDDDDGGGGCGARARAALGRAMRALLGCAPARERQIRQLWKCLRWALAPRGARARARRRRGRRGALDS